MRGFAEMRYYCVSMKKKSPNVRTTLQSERYYVFALES